MEPKNQIAENLRKMVILINRKLIWYTHINKINFPVRKTAF